MVFLCVTLTLMELIIFMACLVVKRKGWRKGLFVDKTLKSFKMQKQRSDPVSIFLRLLSKSTWRRHSVISGRVVLLGPPHDKEPGSQSLRRLGCSLIEVFVFVLFVVIFRIFISPVRTRYHM